MRTFVLMLLLVVVFLVGVVFGSEDESINNPITAFETRETEDILYTSERSDVNTHALQENTAIKMDEKVAAQQTQPIHVTQKIAIFFERAIKGFYEVVVSILYQISLLFF